MLVTEKKQGCHAGFEQTALVFPKGEPAEEKGFPLPLPRVLQVGGVQPSFLENRGSAFTGPNAESVVAYAGDALRRPCPAARPPVSRPCADAVLVRPGACAFPRPGPGTHTRLMTVAGPPGGRARESHAPFPRGLRSGGHGPAADASHAGF